MRLQNKLKIFNLLKAVGLTSLPEKLQEIAELRLEYPEVSLKTREMIPSGAISKSGINHRIRKINEFAEKLREKVRNFSAPEVKNNISV